MGIKLTSDQWIILKRLSEVGGTTQSELSASISKDPASLTRSLDILEKGNLIVREVADRRSFKVMLTNEGEKVVAIVIPEAVKFRKLGIKGISEDDLKILKKVLNTMTMNFNKM